MNQETNCDHPKISIITVVFNGADTIEQTISSVVNQTYDNIEYIVIDGNSTDGTQSIIKKYESQIAYWISEMDDGIYDAMNKGIKVASGDYIEIIGSDDCLHDNTIIEQVVPYLDNSTDILSCGQIAVYENINRELYVGNHFARERDSYQGGMIPHGSMLVRTELMRKHLFDTSYRIAADYKFFLECYFDDSVRFKFLDIPLTYFSADGLSSNRDECDSEDNRIYRELNLPLVSPLPKGPLKKIIKSGLDTLHLYDCLKLVYDKYFLMKKHKCNNKICRWCNRK